MWRCLNVGIALIAGIVGFFVLVHPILAFFLPRFHHEGLAYYQQGTYLKYPAGDRFRDVLSSFDFVESGQVVDFYHANHWMLDNPIYGKHRDVFCADVYLDDDTYTRTRELVDRHSTDNEVNGVYTMYTIDAYADKKGDVVLIALCDSEPIVRCILMTDVDSDAGKYGHGSFFLLNTRIDWTKISIPTSSLGCETPGIFEMHYCGYARIGEITSPEEASHFPDGEPRWDYDADDWYDAPELQQEATKIAEAYPLTDRENYANIRNYVEALYSYMLEAGTLEQGLVPKCVHRYLDAYLMIEFLTPVFDTDGNEITPEDADTVCALISAEDGHIIHFGRAND